MLFLYKLVVFEFNPRGTVYDDALDIYSDCDLFTVEYASTDVPYIREEND